VWQNKRSGLVSASGRSQFDTSAASRIRPVPPPQRDPGNRLPQQAGPHLAVVQGTVEAAVPAAALRLQAQLRQHGHPLRPARQRVARLEQHVPAHTERTVQLTPETRQQARPAIRPVPVLMPGHNESHGHRLGVFKFCGRNPKIIKRWPPHVTTIRRTAQATQDSRATRLANASGVRSCRMRVAPSSDSARIAG
jgi:hypothetical protein